MEDMLSASLSSSPGPATPTSATTPSQPQTDTPPTSSTSIPTRTSSLTPQPPVTTFATSPTTSALPTTTLTTTTTSTHPATSTSTSTSTFTFPPHHSFPPFYTLQPNLTTLSRQLALWSSLIQSYCASTSLFRLTLSTAPTLPLFSNPTIQRSLDTLSIRRILDYMSSTEGSQVAEWISPTSSTTSSLSTSRREIPDKDKTAAWIWFKSPLEWGELIHAWVDETGQKGSILTVYELRESDAVQGKEWVGMEEAMLRRCLEGLVRRGRTQVFEGVGGDGAGVKFF